MKICYFGKTKKYLSVGITTLTTAFCNICQGPDETNRLIDESWPNVDAQNANMRQRVYVRRQVHL